MDGTSPAWHLDVILFGAVWPRAHVASTGMQAIKECNIHLSHLNTHYASAQRLRAALRADTESKDELQERADGLSEQVTLCASACTCHGCA